MPLKFIRNCLPFFFLCISLAGMAQPKKLLEASLLNISHFKYDDAIANLNECVSLARQTTDNSVLAVALEKRAYCYKRKLLADSAKADYFSLLGLPEIHKNKTELVRVLNLLASSCIDRSQPDSAVLYADSALKMASSLHHQSLMAKANQVLGQAYFAKTFLEKANEYWLEAQRLAEQANDSLIAAEVISLRGLLNSDLKNQKEALRLQFMAFDQLIHNKQLIEAGTSYMGMGVCYKRLKKYDSAVYYYKKALSLGDSVNDIKLIGRAYHNLADVYTYKNVYDSAMIYSTNAVNLFKERNVLSWILVSQQGLAQLYRVMGDNLHVKSNYENAVPIILENIEIAKKIQYREYLAKAYEEISYCYDGLNEHKKAFQYFYEYYMLNDSIRNEKTTSRVADLQAMYETEKKEKEILLLNTEKKADAEKLMNQRRLNYSLLAFVLLIIVAAYFIYTSIQKKRAAERKLAVLEKQTAIDNVRSRIARDVHDDIGANLTRLGLNAQQLAQTAANDQQRTLASKLAAQSREAIIGVKEIIWASNPSNDNLKSLLSFMRQYADRFFDGTNIQLLLNFPQEVQDVRLHPEVHRNLFLILKEALNNALKYSGTDKIEISFSNEEDNYQFDIKDYGRGLSGTSNDEAGNGLKNMNNRASQINAGFTIKSAPGEGVHITIRGKLY